MEQQTDQFCFEIRIFDVVRVSEEGNTKSDEFVSNGRYHHFRHISEGEIKVGEYVFKNIFRKIFESVRLRL